MIGQLLGPVSQLAGTWLNGKVEEKAAQNKVKVAKAEAEAQIMLSAATSEAEWEKIMAQGTQNSWKDEYLVLLFSIPLILAFLPFLSKSYSSTIIPNLFFFRGLTRPAY